MNNKKLNFKGFMADSAHANFNAMKRMFVFGDPTIPMHGREQICLMHWAKSMEMHTRCLIKPNIQNKHKSLCHQ